MERLWLKSFLRDTNLIVQSGTMALEVRNKFGVDAVVMPFLPNNLLTESGNSIDSKPTGVVKYDYLYVATGEPHKNHMNLIKAWAILAGRGCKPTLCLTLSEKYSAGLIARISEYTELYGLNVVFREVDNQDVRQLYMDSGALIYPSLFESFGLPLFEARATGLPILAAEADYVRDAVEPVQTFDPQSDLSIARAVLRFEGADSENIQPMDAGNFLDKICGN